MPKLQQMIVLVGFGIILSMGLFPPWSYVDDAKVGHSMGYAPIWKPPVQRSHDSAEFLGLKLQMDLQSQTANSIDFAKLLMQIGIVAIITAGASLLFKRATA